MRTALVWLVLALALVAARPATAEATHDAAANARIIVPEQTWRASNVSATTVPGEPLTANGPGTCGRRKMGRTLWYRLNGNGARVYLDTARSTVDTALAVYTSAQPPSQASFLTCDVDPRGDAEAALTIQTAPATEYLVQVGGLCLPDCAGGTLRLTARSVAANDDRNAAERVACCTRLAPRTLLGATTEPGEPLRCGATAVFDTVWFRFTAPDEGKVTFDPGSSRRSTAVYDAVTGRRLACDATGDGATSVRVHGGQELLVQLGRSRGATAYAFAYGTTFAVDHDRDNDGHRDDRGDCNDRDARVNPDALDLPGDGVDRNCDGTDSPVVRAEIKLTFSRLQIGRVVRVIGVKRVSVRRARRGSKVTVTCRGRGCRFRERRRTVARKAVTIRGLVRQRRGEFRFRKVTIVVVVQRPGTTGTVARFVVRRLQRGKPRRTNLCMYPGAPRPRRCR